MSSFDLFTIAEAASALQVSKSRVHQLLRTGELASIELPTGRLHHRAGSKRIEADSVQRLIETRVGHPRLPAATDKESPLAGPDGVATELNRAAAARAAAQELKVQLDQLRESLRHERARTQRVLGVAAEMLELLRDSTESADQLDDITEGYSQALTQLLSPDSPP